MKASTTDPKGKKTSPWIRGIVDTLVGAAVLRGSTIPTKNRLAVILVDTAFETACRAFLKHNVKINLDQNHSHRDHLVKTVRSKLSDIDAEVWNNIAYYYTDIRCDFYHQSAGKTVTDTDLLDYQETVEFVIDKAFGIKIADLVREATKAIQLFAGQSSEDIKSEPSTHQFADDRDKVLVAVGAVSPESVEEINAFFKHQGDRLRLKPSQFTDILARNSGTKNFFCFNREMGRWELSALGRFKFQELLKKEQPDE